MIERLQAVLEEMDGWLAKAHADDTTPVPKDELVQWHITLTTVYEEMSVLQDAAQLAVDAFLLRPSKPDPSTRTTDGSGRPTGQKLYHRLAETMAELEQVLADLQASADGS